MDWKLILSHYPNFSVVLILCFTIALFLWFCRKRLKNPPGPWCIPVFGCFPFKLRGGLIFGLNLATLAKIYGVISSIKIGSKRIIVLNDYIAIKEAFLKSDEFTPRPTKLLKMIGLTLASATLDELKPHRRLFLNVMKNPKNESYLLDEISYLLEEFRERVGDFFDPSNLLLLSANNVISLVSFGQRSEYSCKKFQDVVASLSLIRQESSKELYSYFFPWMNKIPFINRFFFRNNLLRNIEKYTLNNLKQKIEEYINNYIPGKKDNFADSYLMERQNYIDKTGNEGIFAENKLIANIIAFYHFGSETTAASLLWILFFIGTHIKVYDNIRQEIIKVIGKTRPPSIKDKLRMPYTQATILEMLRCSTISSLTLFHCNNQKTKVCGISIPKQSVVIGNVWAVHNNPEIWNDPEKFRPERFIGDNGKLQNLEFLIPYSIGKRRCIAESLVQSVLFLFVASFCQQFRIEVEEIANSSNNSNFRFEHKPKPFNIKLLIN